MILEDYIYWRTYLIVGQSRVITEHAYIDQLLQAANIITTLYSLSIQHAGIKMRLHVRIILP